MKTSEITAGKVYGDGLGRKRWVKRIYDREVPGGSGSWFVEKFVDYKKVYWAEKLGTWQEFEKGTCKLVTFASWAKEELE